MSTERRSMTSIFARVIGVAIAVALVYLGVALVAAYRELQSPGPLVEAYLQDPMTQDGMAGMQLVRRDIPENESAFQRGKTWRPHVYAWFKAEQLDASLAETIVKYATDSGWKLDLSVGSNEFLDSGLNGVTYKFRQFKDVDGSVAGQNISIVPKTSYKWGDTADAPDEANVVVRLVP